jgi:hypothetical protein
MLSYDWATASISIEDPEMISSLGNLYRETHYLEQVSDTSLSARFDGLVANIVVIGPDGTPYFKVPNRKDGIAFIELIEELSIRNWDIKAILGNALRRFANIFKRSYVERISQQLSGLAGKKCLFKFTEAKYTDDILSGKVRFKSAASYNNEGFNIAVKDDELNLEHILRGLRLQNADGLVVPVKQNLITAHAAGDYYVSCFSVGFNLKLFALFEYDSCVVIKAANNFVEAVKVEYLRRYPNHHITFGPVEYIDTCRQLKAKRPIEFRKSINFTYENEWRFVAFPKYVDENLEPVKNIEIDRNIFEYRVIEANEA